MSELEQATIRLRKAMSNPAAIKRYEERDARYDGIWECFRNVTRCNGRKMAYCTRRY